MRKILTAFTLLSALSAAPVLADDRASHVHRGDTKIVSAPDDDVTFAMHMAEHHRDGIKMAEHVIAKGADRAVKDIARRIRDDQQTELARLEDIARQGGKAKTSPPPKDPDMQRGMERLMASSGAEADRLFLELMIAHHASALMMAKSSDHHLRSPELQQMATDSFAKQAREIGELQALRESTAVAAPKTPAVAPDMRVPGHRH